MNEVGKINHSRMKKLEIQNVQLLERITNSRK